MHINLRYWPFDVLPPERRTEQLDHEIAFLEEAYRAGFKPYVFGIGDDFGASASDGREGEIIRRGKKRWELRLFERDVRVVDTYLDNFGCAADAVLKWLSGTELHSMDETLRSESAALSSNSQSSPAHNNE
jgi:hypothetical protein